MSRELPAKPNLEYLKKQAKELLHDFQRSKPHAADRFRAFASNLVARRRTRNSPMHSMSLPAITALPIGRS
jgi:hypothetical protein